jgi:uncharacterized protein (TIRG00374 family)
MAENSFLRRRWKLLLNLVTLVALVLFLYAIRHQLVETANEITHVRWWALLLFFPLLAWKYDAQARLYRRLFEIVGNKFSYRHMYETALELNFVNTVFPSGGVSGISYYGVRMRSENVTAGKATLVQIMKLVLLFLSFEVLLALGLLFLAIGGDVNVFIFMLTVILATLLIVGTALLGFVLGARNRVEVFHRMLKKLINQGYRLLTRGRGHRHFNLYRVHFLLSELHENYLTIRGEWRELKKPFLFALLTNVAEILTIYAVYVAFGEYVNMGAVILAYSVANFAGFISVLPGGVGVYEVLMTTVLVAAGVPAGLSLSVTVMYRVLSTVIQLPPGYYFYHRTLRQSAGPTQMTGSG